MPDKITVDGIPCYVFTDTLVVDSVNGIMGTVDDYSIEDSDQREIEVRIVLPQSFFKPLKVNISVDPQLLAEPATGTTESVVFPVEIDQVNQEVVMTAEAGSRATSFVGYLKKKLREVL